MERFTRRSVYKSWRKEGQLRLNAIVKAAFISHASIAARGTRFSEAAWTDPVCSAASEHLVPLIAMDAWDINAQPGRQFA